MKQTTLKVAAALLLTCSMAITAQSQTADDINVVTTATPFLRISPDARAGGMGDMGIATAPDAYSGFYNLAKTPFAKSKSNIGVTYTPWLKKLDLNDVYLASLSGYYKLDDEQALSGSLRYFSLGNIQFTDFAGNDLQSFRPREFAVDFGYSRKLNNKLGVGVALRYINSSLASGAFNGVNYKAGSTVAGDISVFHNGINEQGEGLTWGVVLSNLGGKIGYTSDAKNKDYIPANLGLGVAYTKVFDQDNKLTFGVDVNKLMVPTPPTSVDGGGPIDSTKLSDYRGQSVVSSWFKSFGDAGSFGSELKEFTFSLGAEYSYADQFFVRAGYFYEDKTKGNRKFFTVGAGVKYNVFGLNFSYLVPSGTGVNQNPLSNTLRFSLLFNLDKDDQK
jgi:Type IX secretion system protein PorV